MGLMEMVGALALTAASPGNVWLVVVDDDAAMAAAEAEVAARGGEARRCFRAGRVCVFELPAGLDGREVLGPVHGVQSVAPDRKLADGPLGPQRAGWPDADGTADCDAPWELGPLGLEALWAEATGKNAPTVMVCDGGFRQSHEDLVGAFAAQWDYGNGDPVAELEWDVGIPAHGTFIAGLLRATPDNGVGRIGLLPEGRLFAAKTADSSGSFYLSAAIEAMADAAEDPSIRVVSYSLSGNGWDDAFAAAVAGLGAHDTLLVAAAGNCAYPYCLNGNNDVFPEYPASYPGDHVLGVAGVKPGDVWNSYSHWGVENVDVAAPGTQLCSLGVDSDDDTYTAAGTSYATPLVGGVAALLMEARPGLTAGEVGDVLRLTAFRTATLSTKVASGRVDGAAALAMPWPDLLPPAPAEAFGVAHLPVGNRGGAGAATLTVGHPAAVTIGAPPGWSATLAQPGVTQVSGPLPKLFEGTLALPVAAAPGPLTLTVRLEAASLVDAEHVRAQPSAGDTVDATGQAAWTWSLTVVTEALPEPGPEPIPEPGPEPVAEPGPEPIAEAGPEPASDLAAGPDAAAEGTPDAGPADPDLGVADLSPEVSTEPIRGGGPSGCTGGPAGGGWALALGWLVARLSWRRRPL